SAAVFAAAILTGAAVFTGATILARTAIATEAAAITAIATGAATAATVPLAITTTHHRRGTLLQRVNADGHIADDVLVQGHLALQLGHRRRRGVEVERDIMRLAVLLDAEGERAQAPIFGLGDLALTLFDDLGQRFADGVDLCRGKVLTRQEDMLVKRHVL